MAAADAKAAAAAGNSVNVCTASRLLYWEKMPMFDHVISSTGGGGGGGGGGGNQVVGAGGATKGRASHQWKHFQLNLITLGKKLEWLQWVPWNTTA